MTCQVCNSKPATIMVKKIINGEQTEMRLCESCAKSQLAGVTSMFNFSDLFGSFQPLNHHITDATKEFADEKNLSCPDCGMDLATLKKTAKVGCGKCYETFSAYMEPFIKGIHGKTVHTGKIARQRVSEDEGEYLNTTREISRIRKQLEEAVKSENYELAAEYRDLIQALTTKGDELND